MFSAFYKPKLAPALDPCYAWIEAEAQFRRKLGPVRNHWAFFWFGFPEIFPQSWIGFLLSV